MLTASLLDPRSTPRSTHKTSAYKYVSKSPTDCTSGSLVETVTLRGRYGSFQVGWTDRQTHDDSIYRTSIASRGKNRDTVSKEQSQPPLTAHVKDEQCHMPYGS